MLAIATELVHSGVSFLRRNPLFPLRAARNATRLEMTIPLDVVRWAIARRPAGKGPERIVVDAAAPGLAVGLTVDLFGTKLDVGAHITIETVETSEGSLRLGLRVRDLAIKAPPGSPAAMMIGSLDLSRPASLLQMMPMKHNALLDAQGDFFVIDLMKIKGIARSAILQRVLAITDGAARIREIRTEDDSLVIGFAVSPTQIPMVLMRLRSGG